MEDMDHLDGPPTTIHEVENLFSRGRICIMLVGAEGADSTQQIISSNSIIICSSWLVVPEDACSESHNQVRWISLP